MKNANKPPRQKITTLIRKAVKERYDLPIRISKQGEIAYLEYGTLGNVKDWHTDRTDACNVRLYCGEKIFFSFGSDA